MITGYDFNGKKVVIAGGMGALGVAVGTQFANAGAKVYVLDRRPLSTNMDTSFCEYRMLDILDEDSIKGFFQEIEQADILVNVVGGYSAGQSVAEFDLAIFDNQIELNLRSALVLTKHALGAMTKHGGKIVHIASRAAVDTGENSFAYSVSKQGVLRLVEAVAAENKDKNLNINAILPSIIDTPANRHAMPTADYDKWPKPVEIAGIILFLCSPDASLINGAAIPVYGKA